MNLHNILINSKLLTINHFLKSIFFPENQLVTILINCRKKLKGKSPIIRKMSKYLSQLKIRLLRTSIKKTRLEIIKEIQLKQNNFRNLLLLQASRSVKKNKYKRSKKEQNQGSKKKKLKKKKMKKKDNRSYNPKLKDNNKKQIKSKNSNPKTIFLMIIWVNNFV